MTTSYTVNIDYELSLSGFGQFPNLAETYEYVFFFMEDGSKSLATDTVYNLEYRDYLTSLGIQFPHLVPRNSPGSIPWWGPLKNIALEKEANSKITSWKYAQTQNLLPPEVFLVEKPTDAVVKVAPSDTRKWLAKAPGLMSGKGHYIVDTTDPTWALGLEKWWERRTQSSSFLFSPFYSRVVDFACVSMQGKIHMHTLDIGPHGSFMGSTVYQNDSDLESVLGPTFKLSEWRALYQKTFDYYQKKFQQEYMGIDSFLYRDINSKILPYAIVEVNCRKTMGMALHSLKRFLPKSGVGKWVFTQGKKTFSKLLEDLGPNAYCKNTSQGILLTSPMLGKHQSFFLCAQSTPQLAHLEEKLSEIIGQK